MLVFEDVKKYYGSKKGVEELSFQLEEGECLAVLGSNGSGKTTTFRLLLGLLKPDEGNIKTSYPHQSEYGYLPEERSLLKELTVFHHVSFLAKLKKMKDEEIEIAYQRWENKLRIKPYRDKRVKELSKGNQQKVQLICCLIHNPKVIVLDEPFTGLDQDNIFLFKQIIQQLKFEKKIILLSSHQHNHIEDLCDKLLVLNQGEMCYFGTIEVLKKQYSNHYITMNMKDYKKSNSMKLKEDQFLGKKIRLLVEEEDYARNYAVWKLLKGQVSYLKFEDSNLTDIMKELILNG